MPESKEDCLLNTCNLWEGRFWTVNTFHSSGSKCILSAFLKQFQACWSHVVFNFLQLEMKAIGHSFPLRDRRAAVLVYFKVQGQAKEQ